MEWCLYASIHQAVCTMFWKGPLVIKSCFWKECNIMNMLKHFESMYTMSYILIQPCVSKCFLVFPPELQQFFSTRVKTVFVSMEMMSMIAYIHYLIIICQFCLKDAFARSILKFYNDMFADFITVVCMNTTTFKIIYWLLYWSFPLQKL